MHPLFRVAQLREAVRQRLYLSTLSRGRETTCLGVLCLSKVIIVNQLVYCVPLFLVYCVDSSSLALSFSMSLIHISLDP
jgi:hypothetical protein